MAKMKDTPTKDSHYIIVYVLIHFFDVLNATTNCIVIMPSAMAEFGFVTLAFLFLDVA